METISKRISGLPLAEIKKTQYTVILTNYNGEEYIYKDKPYKVVEVDILNRKIKIENPERNILEEVFIDYGSFE